jgi:hypothetical protein
LRSGTPAGNRFRGPKFRGLEFYSVPLAFNFQQLRLPRYGDYEIRLLIDNQEVAVAPLMVRQAPNLVQPAQ